MEEAAKATVALIVALQSNKGACWRRQGSLQRLGEAVKANAVERAQPHHQQLTCALHQGAAEEPVDEGCEGELG